VVERLTVDSLRTALRRSGDRSGDAAEVRFEALARRYERAVRALIDQIHGVVTQIPELDAVLEDEVEVFTSPAFPGKRLEIRDQRLRISQGECLLLFDPTARALMSALGQVDVEASAPIPFMVERVLYLIPGTGGAPARWGFRSVENLGGPLAPFTEQALLRMLHCVFVRDGEPA